MKLKHEAEILSLSEQLNLDSEFIKVRYILLFYKINFTYYYIYIYK